MNKLKNTTPVEVKWNVKWLLDKILEKNKVLAKKDAHKKLMRKQYLYKKARIARAKKKNHR